MKFVDVKWCCSGECIGIVLVDNGFGHKAYIGTAPGRDDAADQVHIAQSGQRFPDVYARKLWPDVTDWADAR